MLETVRASRLRGAPVDRQSNPGGTHTDQSPRGAGFAPIGLLAMLLTLGIIGVTAAFAVGTFSNPTPPKVPGATTGATAPSTSPALSSQPGASAALVCDTDAMIVATAVTAYQTTNGGAVPTPSELTASANGNPYLRSFPRSAYFTISIDPSGSVMVALSTTDPAAAAPRRYPVGRAPFEGFPVSFEAWSWSKAVTRGAAYPGTANVCAGA